MHGLVTRALVLFIHSCRQFAEKEVPSEKKQKQKSVIIFYGSDSVCKTHNQNRIINEEHRVQIVFLCIRFADVFLI